MLSLLKKLVIKKNRKLLLSIFVFFIFLFLPKDSQAGVLGLLVTAAEATIFEIIATILYIPIYIFGMLATSIFIPALIEVARFNQFVTQQGVIIGWGVVRDFAYMFIVLGILIIAMGTLFNIESYSYKKLLPKFIVGAAMITFSKMIIGFMIDVSQVLTLTFVHAFEQIAAGNLINAMGLQRIVSLKLDAVVQVINSSAALAVLGSLLLGGVALAITCAVLLVLIVYFVARIIILWIAIILSPLLFVLPFIPKADKFSSQVWEMISKQLISGPLVAFFLWLSFRIMDVLKNPSDSIFQEGFQIENQEEFTVFISEFGNINSILNFMVVVGLLMTSLMMAQQMGAAGSKFAGDVIGGLKVAGKWAAMRPVKVADWADRKMFNATGFGFYRTPRNFVQGLKEYNKYKRNKEEQGGIVKAQGHLTAGGFRSVFLGAGAGRDYAETYMAGGFLNRKGFGRAARVLAGGKERYGEIQKEIDADKAKIAELEIEKVKGDAFKAFMEKYTGQFKTSDEALTAFNDQLANIEKQKKGLTAKRDALGPGHEDEWVDFNVKIKTLEDEEKELSGQKDKAENDKKEADQILQMNKDARMQMALQEYEDKAVRLEDDAVRLERGDWSNDEVNGFNLQLIDLLKKQKELMAKRKDQSLSSGLREQAAEEEKAVISKIKAIKAQVNNGPEAKEREDRKKRENEERSAEKLRQEAKNYRTWAKNTAEGTVKSVAAIENEQAELRKKNKEREVNQSQYAMPSTFYSDQVRRSMIAEEMKKITSENAEEQIEACREAIRDKDWAKFLANFHAATKNGNDNEIINELGYLNAYRGPEEDKKPGEGGGLDAFRKHYLEGIFKMGEQASMAEMDDIGYEAENIGHWSVARGYGIKGGMRYAKSYEDQQNEVYAEQTKIDSRKLNRQMNRLSSGGENYLENGTKEFIFEPYELKRIASSLKVLVKEMQGGEFNKSKAEKWSSARAMEQLMKLKGMLPQTEHSIFDTFIKELQGLGAKGRTVVGKYSIDDLRRQIGVDARR